VRGVTFDSDILRLLPKDAPAVQSFKRFLQTFGSLDHLYIVFESPDGIAAHAEKMGPAYARMGAERGQHDPWTPDLVAEGDARELQRAIQDLRKDAGLELDDRIDLWVANAADDVAPYLAAVAAEVLADSLTLASPDGAAPATHGQLDLAGGPAEIWIRRREEG